MEEAVGILCRFKGLLMTPVGLMAAAPLENRFPQPAADLRDHRSGGRRQRRGQQGEGRVVFDEGEQMIDIKPMP